MRITTEQTSRKLSWGRRLLLVAIASVAVAAPVFAGLVCAGESPAPFQTGDTAAKPQKFEVASIRLIPDNDVVPLHGESADAAWSGAVHHARGHSGTRHRVGI